MACIVIERARALAKEKGLDGSNIHCVPAACTESSCEGVDGVQGALLTPEERINTGEAQVDKFYARLVQAVIFQP